MKTINLGTEFHRCRVTADEEGFHFEDLDDGEEIWISDDDIKKLIEFLQDN